MTKETSNIGEVGTSSIRIGGRKVEDLPIAESAQAQVGLQQAIKDEHQKSIDDVKAKYPTQSVAYLEGRVKECEDNIRRVNELKGRESALINEYAGIITICKFRDDEIRKLDDTSVTYKTDLKVLQKKFPLYNVEKMELQIEQSTDALERCDVVIASEYSDIAMLREVIGQCQRRDIELQKLGV